MLVTMPKLTVFLVLLANQVLLRESTKNSFVEFQAAPSAIFDGTETTAFWIWRDKPYISWLGNL